MSSGRSKTLVLGLTGQIGRAFRDIWPAGDALVAISRRPHGDAYSEAITWLQTDIGQLTGVEPILRTGFDQVFSFGPLDALAEAFSRGAIHTQRLIAIGSTSVHSKKNSPLAAERQLAQRLQCAEEQLFETATRRGIHLLILRPTLLWGNGLDRSLTPLVRQARRWRVMALPWSAGGLRQPVHVADVARAAYLGRSLTGQIALDLPGGETLTVQAMLARSLRAGAPRAVQIRLPNSLYIPLFRAIGRLRGTDLSGFLSRLDTDMIFDSGPAQTRLSLKMRGFSPEFSSFAQTE